MAQAIREMELLFTEMMKTEEGSGFGEKIQKSGFGHFKFEMPIRYLSQNVR